MMKMIFAINKFNWEQSKGQKNDINIAALNLLSAAIPFEIVLGFFKSGHSFQSQSLVNAQILLPNLTNQISIDT